ENAGPAQRPGFVPRLVYWYHYATGDRPANRIAAYRVRRRILRDGSLEHQGFQPLDRGGGQSYPQQFALGETGQDQNGPSRRRAAVRRWPRGRHGPAGWHRRIPWRRISTCWG